MSEVRLAWDTVGYVLSFDLEGQQEFLTAWGLETIPGTKQLLWIAGAAALLRGGYAALILRRSRTPPDAVKRLYEIFCRKAARLGAARWATDGPADFAQRAGTLLPREAAYIQRVASSYIALRYSSNPGPSTVQTFAADVRAFAGSSAPITEQKQRGSDNTLSACD